MSSIGKQILEEFKNEINERIEDDKPKMQLEQVMSWLGLVWRMFGLAVKSILLMTVLNFFFVLYTADLYLITSMQTSTPEEILSAIEMFFYTSFLLAFGIFVAMASTSHAQRVRNVKQERLEQEEREIHLVTTAINLTEEVLLRHGLIKKGDA
jgi:hypothetical protein